MGRFEKIDLFLFHVIPGKAGEGRANPQSMVDAIKLAIQLAKKKN